MVVTRRWRRHYAGNSNIWYRFERHGRSIVYSTDCENKMDDLEREQVFVDFFDEADLIIFDTMYTFAEALTMEEDWGHSSGMTAVDLCHKAHARKLAMFHLELIFDDATIERHQEGTARYEELTRDDAPPLEILCSYDGLEVEV